MMSNGRIPADGKKKVGLRARFLKPTPNKTVEPEKLGVPSKPQFSDLSKASQRSLEARREERTGAGGTGAGGLLKMQTQSGLPDLEARSAATKKLFAQHTVGHPKIGYAAARADLESFFQEAKDVTPEQLSDIAKKRPELLDAALDFLAYRFTPAGFRQVGGDPDAKTPTQVALRLVQEMDAPRQDKFLSSVVFNVAHPANHAALWPAIVGSISAEKLEDAILDRAGSDNELHANNAFHLPFHVSGRKPGYTLSPAGREKLQALREQKLEDASTNPMVREGLEQLGLP